MIRPLFTSLFIMLFLAACAPGAGPLPLTGLPTSSATGDAEAEEEAPADLGDSVAEIDEAEASPTWTAPTAGSVECPALAASVSLVLDDLAAIDTEQLTLGLRVGVNQDTGSVDQQPDTSSADKEKVNWDEVRWNEMKPVKDKDDDDEGSPWKAPSLPDASDIFVIEKTAPLLPLRKFPENRSNCMVSACL